MRGKKFWKVVAVIILATVLVGTVWMFPPSPEPVYQGKPLTYWLAKLGGPGHQTPSKMDSTSAVQHIGTNAIPTLLALLQSKDLGLAEKLNPLLDHLPWVNLRLQTVADKYKIAMTGFKMLGSLGRGALPDLIRIYEQQPHSLSPRREIAEIFGIIGDEAVPAVPFLVLAVATDPFAEQRGAAAGALGGIAERPEICIPALLAALRDASELVRTDAAISLGKFDSQPDNIVPALIAALRDPALGVKYFAAQALGHLHLQPENSIPILTMGLGDSNNIVVRRASAVALSEFGPAARAALPILRLAVLQMHNAPDSALSVYLRSAKEAIAKISPSNSELCDFQY